ncbi:UNVERIFIED_CONTAM: hypothetical protein HDU68_004050 [Siphonaria sp. JEL0065]|nr:hypothetical protein HDU68_004050 [Siphonaria sp. JEL0065]
MATTDDNQLYGLDKELADKAAAKYDPQRELEARNYIEQVSGHRFPSDNFHESLKDGTILCHMINNILPQNQIKVVQSKMPFKQMENIGHFLNRVELLGVPAHERFMTVDLFEAKNMNQVVNTIFSISRHAAAKGFQGPVLGPKLTEKNERTFTEEQLQQARAMPSKLMSFSTNVSSGLNFGGRREIGGKYLEKSSSDDKLGATAAAAAAPAAEKVVVASSPLVQQTPVIVAQQAPVFVAQSVPVVVAQAPPTLSAPAPAQSTPSYSLSSYTPSYSTSAPTYTQPPAAETPAEPTFVPPPRSYRAPTQAQVSAPVVEPAIEAVTASVNNVSLRDPSPAPRRPSNVTTGRPPTAATLATTTTYSTSPTRAEPPVAKETPTVIPKATTLSITQFKTYAEYKAAKAALEAANNAGASSYTPSVTAVPDTAAATAPAAQTAAQYTPRGASIGGTRSPQPSGTRSPPRRDYSRERTAAAPTPVAQQQPSAYSRARSQERTTSRGGVQIVREYARPVKKEESDDEVVVIEEDY